MDRNWNNLFIGFILIIALSLLLVSCEDKKVSKKDCEQLSMQAYKGAPPSAASDFKKHCSGVEVFYTRDRCQNAFTKFMIYGDEEKLKKEFGMKIMGCFTKRNIKDFKRN